MSQAKPIAGATEADVREVLANVGEEEVFGPALSQVKVLRASVREAHLPALEVANAMMEARAYFQSFGIYPPCLELLDNGHHNILVEYLLPEEAQPFRDKVVLALRERLAAEIRAMQAGGASAAAEEEDDEEEEDGEDGDEGQGS